MGTGTAVETKVCRACGEEKSLDRFYADSRYAGGRKHQCKTCESARAYARRDPESARAANRRWYERNRESENQRKRDHYSSHPEQYAASHAAWRERNREHRNAYMRDYIASRIARDPEFAERMKALSRQTTKTREARKRGQFVEHVDPRIVWQRDEGVCGICREPVLSASEFEVDHIIPLAQGGEHSYANTQVSHALCNRRKGGGHRD